MDDKNMLKTNENIAKVSLKTNALNLENLQDLWENMQNLLFKLAEIWNEILN